MEQQKIVGVKFEEGGKVYYFDPQNVEYKKDTKVIVETSRGIELGTIMLENELIDANKLAEPLKKVIRVATEKDLKVAEKLKEKEKNAVSEAKRLSEKFKLDMSIVDAEYTFDESKVIISFTSDGRVDFRELVKELAYTLHARIELRQVGIRDEAKMLGGIGLCGKEVCCKQFLSDFDKVSIKMAKNQGISLNPTNINGICGRLLCCLAYENDTYVELLNEMPKLNSKVKLKTGEEGTVVYNNLLKKLVSVKVVHSDESFTIDDYKLEDIEVIKRNSFLVL
ncbi:MAG: stage 0 sporulation family protein [Clostridiales bacterium]|nr:stage 0 sporulation family protein [Candidatus Apopatousia equi]